MRNGLKTFCVIIIIAGFWACGGPQEVKTEPEPVVVAPPPPTAPPDPTIGRAYRVMRHFGRQTKKYISYEAYMKKRGGSGSVTSISPDWFYDTFSLDLNRDGYWVTANLQSAQKAVDRDPRIEKLLSGAPLNSIDMKVKTPRGRVYILSDSEADGVLDFAAPATKKSSGAPPVFDAKLRDSMQKTYTWLVGIIKSYYKKIR